MAYKSEDLIFMEGKETVCPNCGEKVKVKSKKAGRSSSTSISCPKCGLIMSEMAFFNYGPAKLGYGVDEFKKILETKGIKLFDYGKESPFGKYVENFLQDAMNRMASTSYPKMEGIFDQDEPKSQDWMDFKDLLESFGLENAYEIVEECGGIDIGRIYSMIEPRLQGKFLQKFNELFPVERLERLSREIKEFIG